MTSRTKEKQQLLSLKIDCYLFSRYISHANFMKGARKHFLSMRTKLFYLPLLSLANSEQTCVKADILGSLETLGGQCLLR